MKKFAAVHHPFSAGVVLSLGVLSCRDDSFEIFPATVRKSALEQTIHGEQVDGSIFQGIRDLGDGQEALTSIGKIYSQILSLNEISSRLESKKNTAESDFFVRVSPPNPWQILDKKLATVSDNELLSVLVEFEDIPFDWKTVGDGSKTANERDALLGSRRDDISQHLDPALKAIQALGTEPEILWISSAIAVRISAFKVKYIRALPGVKSIFVIPPKGYSGLPYEGYWGRSSMRVNQMLAQGITGSQGNRLVSTNPVRIGINDSRDVFTNHLGFQRNVGGNLVSVFEKYYVCGTSCQMSSSNIQGDSHGTAVARIAIGSIENNQDPIYSGVSAISRSGISYGNNVRAYYYGDDPIANSYASVLQQAIVDGVDVMNFSNYYADSQGYCNPNYSPVDNLAFKNALDANLVSIFAIGNDGDLPGCTAAYPSVRRDGFAVGALQSDTSVSYASTAMSTYSARGGAPITLSNGNSIFSAIAIADLAAPGRWYLWYRPNFNSYDTSTVSFEEGYTSFAAPTVTAAFAYFRHAFQNAGWTNASGRDLMANLLLLGDGYAGQTGGTKNSRLDIRSGTGRIKLHRPSGFDLTSPFEWTWGNDSISANQEKSYAINGRNAIPTSATQLKFAMLFDEYDYSNAADIDISIYDVCPEGGGSPQLIKTDTSYDFRARIYLSGTELRHSNGTGRCLEWRASGLTMPSGQSRKIYAAYYWHSGPTADH